MKQNKETGILQVKLDRLKEAITSCYSLQRKSFVEGHRYKRFRESTDKNDKTL